MSNTEPEAPEAPFSHAILSRISMNPSLPEKQQSWIDHFALIENPAERLQALVDRTRNLPGLQPDERLEIHRVEGCVSKVWLCGRLDARGCCAFAADAESVVVQGLVRLLCHLYSGHPPEEVIAEPPRLWPALRLDRQLSPTRLHGLGQVHRRIVALATAFLAEKADVSSTVSGDESRSVCSHAKTQRREGVPVSG